MAVAPPTELCGITQSTQSGSKKIDMNSILIKKKDKRFTDELDEYKKNIETPEFLKNIKMSSKIMNHYLLDTYSMKSKTRGVLFLINNIDFLTLSKRKGAESDRVNLVTLFRAFGFVIYYYENVRSNQFNELLNILIKSEVLKNADCLVFGILTHGDEENYAVFTDEGRIYVEDILFRFNNRDCPSLKDKPKIFLFPFCRGSKSDLGVSKNYRAAERDSSEQWIVPKTADTLICYGSVPGTKYLFFLSFFGFYFIFFLKVLLLLEMLMMDLGMFKIFVRF